MVDSRIEWSLNSTSREGRKEPCARKRGAEERQKSIIQKNAVGARYSAVHIPYYTASQQRKCMFFVIKLYVCVETLE